MICPECEGLRSIDVPGMAGVSCPTCEGLGELSDVPALHTVRLVVSRWTTGSVGAMTIGLLVCWRYLKSCTDLYLIQAINCIILARSLNFSIAIGGMRGFRCSC
jgi:hypothetical protein